MSEIDWSKAPEGATHYCSAHQAWRNAVIDTIGDCCIPLPRPTKQEWEGGLPPVGVECEFVFNRMWVSAKVVGYDGPACVVAIDGEGYEGSRNPSDFRPVKSQHERLRDELVRAIAATPRKPLKEIDAHDIADAILSRYNLDPKP